MRYRIQHITDLLQIQPEHWDECMSDIRGAMLSIHMVRAAGIMGEPMADPKDMCPYIELEPDGKGEVTPMLNGEALFTMKVTRDAE